MCWQMPAPAHYLQHGETHARKDYTRHFMHEESHAEAITTCRLGASLMPRGPEIFSLQIIDNRLGQLLGQA
jgi:hypothetical protein